MDPYTEQRLREEVIYLHSLWHQGPSRTPPTITLPPLNPTHFKKPKKKKPKFTSKKPKPGNFSGKEWPVKPPTADLPLNPSGWPELKLKPKPEPTRLPTPQELEKHKWNEIQKLVLKKCEQFFLSNGEDSDENDAVEDEYDDDMDEDEDEDEGDVDVDVDVEEGCYDFFWGLFNGDEELKGYYGKWCGGGGEFLCLVCCGANEKHGKRFKDCVALVQHAVSITKTKKLRAHRAYGKVVCKVLGWDIDRLPSSIVTDHNVSSRNVTDCKAGELEGDGVGDHKNVEDLKDVTKAVDGESMVCEEIMAVADVEEGSNKIPVLNEAEGHTGGAVNNLCRNLSSTMVLGPVPRDPQTN